MEKKFSHQVPSTMNSSDSDFRGKLDRYLGKCANEIILGTLDFCNFVWVFSVYFSINIKAVWNYYVCRHAALMLHVPGFFAFNIDSIC